MFQWSSVIVTVTYFLYSACADSGSSQISQQHYAHRIQNQVDPRLLHHSHHDQRFHENQRNNEDDRNSEELHPAIDPNPLPEGWLEYIDPATGKPYYYNVAERTTTWSRPIASNLPKQMQESQTPILTTNEQLQPKTEETRKESSSNELGMRIHAEEIEAMVGRDDKSADTMDTSPITQESGQTLARSLHEIDDKPSSREYWANSPERMYMQQQQEQQHIEPLASSYRQNLAPGRPESQDLQNPWGQQYQQSSNAQQQHNLSQHSPQLANKSELSQQWPPEQPQAFYSNEQQVQRQPWGTPTPYTRNEQQQQRAPLQPQHQAWGYNPSKNTEESPNASLQYEQGQHVGQFRAPLPKEEQKTPRQSPEEQPRSQPQAPLAKAQPQEAPLAKNTPKLTQQQEEMWPELQNQPPSLDQHQPRSIASNYPGGLHEQKTLEHRLSQASSEQTKPAHPSTGSTPLQNYPHRGEPGTQSATIGQNAFPPGSAHLSPQSSTSSGWYPPQHYSSHTQIQPTNQYSSGQHGLSSQPSRTGTFGQYQQPYNYRNPATGGTSYSRDQQEQVPGQIVSQTSTTATAVKEALGSAWQGVLGFGSRTKEIMGQAKDSVVQSASQVGDAVTSTSVGWWGRAKASVDQIGKSLFEGDQSKPELDAYSLSQYGVPPAPGQQQQPRYPPQHYGGPPAATGQQQPRYPPQSYGGPPPGQQQQPRYPPQNYGGPPPGYGPPSPRVIPPYPHQGMQANQPKYSVPNQYSPYSQGQGRPPMQSYWGPGPQRQWVPPNQGRPVQDQPVGNSRPSAYSQNGATSSSRTGQGLSGTDPVRPLGQQQPPPSQQQAQQQRAPHQGWDPLQHPGWGDS